MAFLLFPLSSFVCPKEEIRKWHPNQSWPYGLPLLLDEGGTNGGEKTPIGTQPSTGEAAEKRICTV
jgi:hypothetical protein